MFRFDIAFAQVPNCSQFIPVLTSLYLPLSLNSRPTSAVFLSLSPSASSCILSRFHAWYRLLLLQLVNSYRALHHAEYVI